jgi:hypothetical protein
VVAARRGIPGTHLQRTQAPIAWLSGCVTVPTTSAQTPHPAQARSMETPTETVREMMSFADRWVNCIARIRSARWTTEVLEMRIVKETPTAMCATRGLL